MSWWFRVCGGGVSQGAGKGYRLVPDFTPINGQCELVPRPILNPDMEGKTLADQRYFLPWTAFKVTGNARYRRKSVNTFRS